MLKPSPASNEPVDLVIVGAGPVGTSLAILAVQRGFSTILVDARDPSATPATDTRTFAIVRGSWRMLGATGVHPLLEGVTEPLNGLEAVDGGSHVFGAPGVIFGNEDLPQDDDGQPLGQMVPSAALQKALDEVAGQIAGTDQGLIILNGARFQALEDGPGPATVLLEDGTRIRTRLVAACDGVNSSVRTALGIGTEDHDYGKSVFAANVKLDRPHEGIARQLFMPEGPFATLPMPDNKANLAWYMKRGAAEALAEMPVEDIEAELNARFADFAGRMTIDGPVISYPLKMRLAQAMTGPRVALLGDAAHRINPLAGQGLNLGFKDVAALIDIMVESREVGLDHGAAPALERYQQWRRFDMTSVALFMDVIDRAFSNDNAVLKPLRGLAMTAANKIGPLRRAMARQASADQSHLPSLMQ
ncbi:MULTISPECIES: FAD-dependent monooxygenase [Hyphomonas]|uniref:2-octaprenyl-3-methyl-6-methoxy-1,4-benzoquinol hydroxylase n=1 Tax=Hyphomonas adhaerens TaxID=81029 RepID=A0A3B9GY43_9PROT|nr:MULTISPECIES: FAD-dependent monooxygenase [Hyphomonas]MBB39338.1 2-octaprenyl-3-methyl-6-methoxy-1,4-benzoquinol hydroxylase [Hyphomonas sp.]HAE27362.1 2-octaprenyl-3-methyl-6-methoxy-1,4-benzoquinol hydroxylase [Hyphomonas adhaerens]